MKSSQICWLQRGLGALFLIFSLGNVAAVARQASPPLTYERYDVDLTVQPDGTTHVREVQQIRFGGEFHTAFAEVPLALTTAIEGVRLSAPGMPYVYSARDLTAGTYNTGQDGQSLYVNWQFTPTVAGDLRTFILEYDVIGGLWVYPDQQLLEWRAVPADRSGIPVQSSAVTVTLPSAVAVKQLQSTAYGPAFATSVSTGTVVFSATEPIPDGVQFQVQVGFPPAVTTARVQNWQVREDQAALAYRLPMLAVDLTLAPDGRLEVEEYQRVQVVEGALDQGFRRIPLRFLDRVENITLAEGEQRFSSGPDCRYCLAVQTTPRQPDWARYDPRLREPDIHDELAGQVELSWHFPPLVRGEESTQRLAYQVEGAVQHFADHQQLNWAAVYPDRAERVETAQVRLHLPAGLDPQAITVDGGGGAVHAQEDGTLLITSPGHIPAQRSWVIGVRMPVTATTAGVPGWQSDLERIAVQAQQDAIRRARVQLTLTVLPLLILALGLSAVFGLWYVRGRDRPQPAISDYLAEPPSDLPPGIVAYLLDERPTPKGALASLFHLATLGLISINLETPLAFRRQRQPPVESSAEVVTPVGDKVSVPGHLAVLFNALREVMPVGDEVSLYTMERQFGAILPRVYQEMGEEAGRFFDEQPEPARHRWLVIGQWVVLAALALALVLALIFWRDAGWVTIWPALAVALVGAALMGVSRWMARRTDVGVEEANRWRAFRTYLLHLKQYGTLDQAQRILDRYFAYAVALDVEEVVLAHAEALGGQVPVWSYSPVWSSSASHSTHREHQGRESTHPSSPTAASANPIPAPRATVAMTAPPSDTKRPQSRPSLSGLSRSFGSALSEASSNLGAFLSTAAGDGEYSTPFHSIGTGTGAVARTVSSAASTTLDVLGEILEESSSGGGGGGYSSSGSSSSSWGSSSSSPGGSSSSFSSGRSSDSRRSAGGGKRGFG